jgi:hypothetical protein
MIGVTSRMTVAGSLLTYRLFSILFFNYSLDMGPLYTVYNDYNPS